MSKINEIREATFLDLAKEYKDKLDKTPWWMFRKRHKLERLRQSALECMIKYGLNQNKDDE